MTSPPDDSDSSAAGLSGLRAWFNGDIGRPVAAIERDLVRKILPDLFGYHLVQVGDSAFDMLESSRISHRLVLSLEERSKCGGKAVARPDSLPILTNAVDVVLLPHTLEFAPNPHGILREAERILIGEGHLLILGFNPWSVFGICRRALGWRGRAPWNGAFLSLARVKDWLSLLGFEIDVILRASFRPPLGRERWLERLAFLEHMGGHFWPVFGNVYAILARKRVASVRPVRASWMRQRRLATSGVVEPTTRGPRLMHVD